MSSYLLHAVAGIDWKFQNLNLTEKLLKHIFQKSDTRDLMHRGLKRYLVKLN